MRRILALLVGAAAVFVVAAQPVAADPGAPQTAAPSNTVPAASVPADAVGVTLAQVSGSGLAVTLDPGASEPHDLVISNHTADLRLTVKITATDATGNLGAGPASWISFGDDAIQLEPHAATTVPMTVAVPHDTQPASALAHVNVAVESAVSAADGSPVAGTAQQTFPVSIVVRGTPSAQIAIADVHRVDQGSKHQLALVLRNFGAEGAQVSGHVRVAGEKSQTLPFHAQLAAGRDTTVNVDWDAPPSGDASDIAVDLEYGAGNVASWSSRLGGAPTDLSPPTSAGPAPTTPIASDSSASTSASVGPAKPWWKQPIVTVLAILALLGAALWFGFEMRASSRRREWNPAYGRAPVPPGWSPGPSEESIDLAKQLVRLTEVVVQLVSSHRDGLHGDGLEITGERARARSPDVEPVDAPPRPRTESFESDELRFARAGPGPPDDGLPGQPPLPFSEPEPLESSRSASLTAGASPRPETIDAPEPVVAEPDPHAAMMARVVELDRERRRLREWMDAEEANDPIEEFDRTETSDLGGEE